VSGEVVVVEASTMGRSRFALRATAFLALWMLHCGNELVAAVPPGQCSLSLSHCFNFFPSNCASFARIVTLFQLGDMQLAGTITPPTPT
jgi:hypothetical protein